MGGCCEKTDASIKNKINSCCEEFRDGFEIFWYDFINMFKEKDPVKLYVLYFHGILEGFASAFCMGNLGYFRPSIYSFILSNINPGCELMIESFSAMNVYAGLIFMMCVFAANAKGHYFILQYAAYALCVADMYYASAYYRRLDTFGPNMLIVAVMDTIFFVSKVILFVFGVAKHHYLKKQQEYQKIPDLEDHSTNTNTVTIIDSYEYAHVDAHAQADLSALA
jgi:hypothetical protein